MHHSVYYNQYYKLLYAILSFAYLNPLVGGVAGWRHGSVVKTSVCSRQTFPYLRLIHGCRVITLWVWRPLWVNQLGQLSLLSLRGR